MNKENAYDLNQEYLTQQEVADLFRVTPSTVKNWRDAGLLDYFQPPGSSRVLYPRESVSGFRRQHIKRAKVIEFRRPAEIKREMPEMSSNLDEDWRI
jgi:hypothetical protein